MMMNNTLAQLRDLKLAGMAAGLEEQLSCSASTALCFEKRLSPPTQGCRAAKVCRQSSSLVQLG